jgi:hypothetical protein
MEHLTSDFGNLGLSREPSSVGASGTGQWPRAQPPPPRNSPHSQGRQSYHSQQSSSSRSNGNNLSQQVSRSGSQDWQQLESDLNAATAKEFVPGSAWPNQNSSNSSVGSNSQGT